MCEEDILRSWERLSLQKQLEIAWGRPVTNKEFIEAMCIEPEVAREIGSVGITYAGEQDIVVANPPTDEPMLGWFGDCGVGLR